MQRGRATDEEMFSVSIDVGFCMVRTVFLSKLLLLHKEIYPSSSPPFSSSPPKHKVRMRIMALAENEIFSPEGGNGQCRIIVSSSWPR